MLKPDYNAVLGTYLTNQLSFAKTLALRARNTETGKYEGLAEVNDKTIPYYSRMWWAMSASSMIHALAFAGMWKDADRTE